MVALHLQRPPATTDLVEAGAPMWAQRMVLKLVKFFQPAFPTAPTQLWVMNKADLPPAADWPGCVVGVRDQDALAVAKGGVWLKIATSGPI